MFFKLLYIFGKIGTFTIGGGYVMIPLIQREICDKQKWMDEEEFMNMIALAQAAPGVIAVNSAIFIGYRVGGWRGLMGAILGAVLPSFLIILLVAMVFRNVRDVPAVEATMKGMRPAVLALLVATVIRLTVTFIRSLNKMLTAARSSSQETNA